LVQEDEILEDEVDGVHHLLEVAEVTEVMEEHHSGELRIRGVAAEEVTEVIEADGVEEVIVAGVHTAEVEDEVEVLEDHVVRLEADAVMEEDEDRLEEVLTAEVEALIQAVLTEEAEVEVQAVHMEALLKQDTAVREEDGVHNNAEAVEEEAAVGKTRAFSHIETDENI